MALGGRGTLYGAALGAGVVNYAKTVLTNALPDVWLFALGALFVLVTVWLPKGLVGLLQWPSKKTDVKEKKEMSGQSASPGAKDV